MPMQGCRSAWHVEDTENRPFHSWDWSDMYENK